MSQTSKSLPRWAQWLAGLALMATALMAGGLSLYMNLAAGLAIGIAVAIAFGLSDVAKLLIPIVCQAIGWTRHLTTVYAVASVVSVACAGLYLADQFGEAIAVKENAAVITTNADQRIDDLRKQLKTTQAEHFALPGQRASAAVQADIETAKQHKRWDSTQGCTDATVTESREFCQAFHALGAELATAQKAERLSGQIIELQGQISAATTKRENAPAEMVDGKAVVIAGALGTDAAATARGTSLVLIIAALIIGELCAHLAGAAAALIGAAMRKPAIAKRPVAKSANAVAKLQAEALAAAPKSGTRAWYLARLQADFPAIASRVAAGELSCYAACIEAGLRKAPKRKKWDAGDYLNVPETV